MIRVVLLLILTGCIRLFAWPSDSTKIVFSKDTVLTHDIEIPLGSSLIINQGVTVKMEGYRAIVIRGLMIAQGTAKEPVVFTSVDRVHGSVDQPSWSGIEIRGKDASGQFKHCIFEGTFRTMVWEANPLFDSCEFTGNHYGLYCTKKAVPHIQNCRFHLNTYAIAADFASPIVAGNVITNNIIGLYLQLNSKPIIGRNVISENQTNIKSEEALGSTQNTFSIQHLWEVMQQLY